MIRNIKIFDTTLRDGEQSPGCSMNKEEKLEIAFQLERLNIDIIEAGFAISSRGDFEAIKTIAHNIKKPIICSLARARQEDIKTAVQNMNNPADSVNIKQQLGTSGWLTPESSDVINNVINCKAGLLPISIDAPKLGKKLETEIFECFDLTKPKIALKLRKYVNVNDLPQGKKDEIVSLLTRIFV